MNVYDFPKNAFLPPRTPRQKLAELFNMRAYGPADIRSIRTSVYYSDFEEAESRLRYIVSTGQALRQSDGRFVVYPAKSQITHDPVRGTVSARPVSEDGQQDGLVLCAEGQVIPRLKELDAALAKHAEYALAFPPNSVLRLSDDLHLNAAVLIFHNRACNRHEIIQQQKTACHYNDRPVLNR